MTHDRIVELLLDPIAALVGIVVGALVVRWLVHRLINRVTRGIAAGTAGISAAVDRQRGPAMAERRRQRAETIASLLRSLTSAVIGTIAGIMLLEVLSIPVGPLLASAGVIGVALGFGAQSLVKDVINGLFMLAEDQYGVGDVVDLGPAAGTVESVGLRVTRLRDSDGAIWYVRNGEVLRVANRSHGFARAHLDLAVGYEADVDRASAELRRIGHELRADEHYGPLLLADPQVLGVQRFATDGVVLRASVTTEPERQDEVVRELRRRALLAFAAAGIELRAGADGPA